MLLEQRTESLARSDPGDALRHLERALELKPQQGEVHWLLVLLVS